MEAESGSAEMTYGVALGSNQGDGLRLLAAARDALVGRASATDVRSASLYRSKPVDCAPGTPDFLNSVVVFRSALAPPEMLRLAQEIEVELGRPREHGFHEPRTVDLDLVFADDVVLDTPELILPHPRAHERLFVLVPLAELEPERVLPGQRKSVVELREELVGEEPMPEGIAW